MTTASRTPEPAHSALYVGQVQHHRHRPHAHAFRYRLFLLYLDLAEIDTVFARRWLWSVERRNLASFQRRDFLGDPSLPLDEAVRQRYAAETGRRPRGPIRLLAHLRYFGYCFNPVAFYYCFHEDGETLDGIVAEITNTPWRQRHSYVLPVDSAIGDDNGWSWQFDKRFHVSPFLPMDRRYRWRLSLPGQRLFVHMNVDADDGRDFDASLSLQRRPIAGRDLAACLLRHPWMSAKVIAAIHWQAFLIWSRRTPVYDHPQRPGS